MFCWQFLKAYSGMDNCVAVEHEILIPPIQKPGISELVPSIVGIIISVIHFPLSLPCDTIQHVSRPKSCLNFLSIIRKTCKLCYFLIVGLSGRVLKANETFLLLLENKWLAIKYHVSVSSKF